MIEKKEIISKIDLAIILTIITGVSYCLSYLYQAGKLIFYNIPMYFIDIGTKDVFFIMLVLVPTIFSFIINMYFETDLARNKRLAKQKSDLEAEIAQVEETKNNTAATIEEITANKENMTSEDLNEIIAKGVDTSKFIKKLKRKILMHKIIKYTILVFYPILIFLAYIGIAKFISTLFGIIWVFQIIISGHLLPFLVKKKRYGILIILLPVLLIVFSTVLGFHSASNTKNFITFEEDKKTFVVLTIYKDQFLYVPLDRKTNNYTEVLKIKEIKDIKGFKNEHLGNIKKITN